jgi:hypothetical protein
MDHHPGLVASIPVDTVALKPKTANPDDGNGAKGLNVADDDDEVDLSSSSESLGVTVIGFPWLLFSSCCIPMWFTDVAIHNGWQIITEDLQIRTEKRAPRAISTLLDCTFLDPEQQAIQPKR